MKQFDAFWDVTKKMNERQVTAVNDRRHTVSTREKENVVTNMAIDNSTKNLYEQCITKAKSEKIQEEQTPSLLWSRLQFWTKNLYTHSAMNYTDRLKLQYMVKQHDI